MTSTRREVRPPSCGMREAPFMQSKPISGDGQILDGFGAVFNRETIIDSWEGRFRERIAMGAMKKSFREAPPKIQFDHGRHPLIGSLPIAKLERVAEEVDPELAPEGGAHIVGRILDNWLTVPFRDAIAAGTVDGMSFRFEVVREAWEDFQGRRLDGASLLRELERTWDGSVPDEELPLRTMQELKVREMGPVVWPAYDSTSVGIRSQVIDLGRLRDPDTRKMLATAVFLADAAQQDDEPRATDTESADEHPSKQPDAPQVTDTKSAGEHPSNISDAPRATDAKPSAVEHPSSAHRSNAPKGRRPVDIMVRRSQDALLDIHRKRDRHDFYNNASRHTRPQRRRPAS